MRKIEPELSRHAEISVGSGIASNSAGGAEEIIRAKPTCVQEKELKPREVK